MSEHLRSASLRQRLRERRTDLVVIPTTTADLPTLDDTRAAVLLPLVRARRITAIAFPNDLGMLGFVERARRDGVRIPEDVSVTGCDGIAFGTSSQGWATVRLPVEKVAARGAELMSTLLREGAPEEVVHERHPGEFVPGGTLARIHPS